MPDGLADRNADVWEALLAVADLADGDWPKTARVAAVALVAQSQESSPSLGVRLLADLRTVFADRDAMPTADVLAGLAALDESPWADLHGKPLTATGLARRLREYEVKSRNIRVGEKVTKGYCREDLHDPWTRYPMGVSGESKGLDAQALHQKSATPATSATSADQGATEKRYVADRPATPTTLPWPERPSPYEWDDFEEPPDDYEDPPNPDE